MRLPKFETERVGSTTLSGANRSEELAMSMANDGMAATNRTIGEIVNGAAAIGAAGTKIAGTVKTIGEISFQSSLLALNAAVEVNRLLREAVLSRKTQAHQHTDTAGEPPSES